MILKILRSELIVIYNLGFERPSSRIQATYLAFHLLSFSLLLGLTASSLITSDLPEKVYSLKTLFKKGQILQSGGVNSILITILRF